MFSLNQYECAKHGQQAIVTVALEMCDSCRLESGHNVCQRCRQSVLLITNRMSNDEAAMAQGKSDVMLFADRAVHWNAVGARSIPGRRFGGVVLGRRARERRPPRGAARHGPSAGAPRAPQGDGPGNWPHRDNRPGCPSRRFRPQARVREGQVSFPEKSIFPCSRQIHAFCVGLSVNEPSGDGA